MNCREQIKEKLFSLEADIFEDVPHNNSMSLMQGIGGLPILYLQLYKATKSRNFLKKIDVIVDQLIDIVSDAEPSVTFCEGIAGIGFMLNYMQKETTHNKQTIKELSGILDNLMLTFYKQHNSFYDLDFLHGSAGILVAWLSKRESSVQTNDDIKMLMSKYITAVNVYLDGLADPENKKKIVNCGMAHGLISQIMILSLYTAKLKDNKYIPTLQRIVDLLVSVQADNDNPLASSFPSIIGLNDAKPDNKYLVPMGWCYGDTVVSVGLAKAGEILNDQAITNQAYQVAARTMARKTDEQAIIYDASFCHGSSSIAHTYNKWRWQSNSTVFDDAYTKWIMRTLELCQFTDGIGGYKKFEGNKFTASAGLLDGAAGVALVLADYVYNQKPTWDSVFLLS
jgi:lantibiotic modifying enzyme